MSVSIRRTVCTIATMAAVVEPDGLNADYKCVDIIDDNFCMSFRKDIGDDECQNFGSFYRKSTVYPYQ